MIRERTSRLLEQLKESLDLISTLKTAIERKHQCNDSICGRVQAAATPIQIVHFLMWISKNAERLAKFIPAFSRNVHHTPNVEFIEKDREGSGGSSSSNVDSYAKMGGETSTTALPESKWGAAVSAGPFSSTANQDSGSSHESSGQRGAAPGLDQAAGDESNNNT